MSAPPDSAASCSGTVPCTGKPPPLRPEPADLAAHLRRLNRRLTAVQSRSSPPTLLFAQPPPSAAPQPDAYPTLYDPYDLRPHPAPLPLQASLLSSNIERAFVVLVPIYSGLVHEVVRLATWRNRERTALWATTYAVCWWFGLILPAGLAVFLALCVWPAGTAGVLFPPEPGADGSRAVPDDSDGLAAVQTADSAPAPGWQPPGSLPVDQESLEEPAGAFADELACLVSEAVPAAAGRTAGECPGPPPSPPPEPRNASVYRPMLLQYGAITQTAAGSLADWHERWRNLFLLRTCPPPGSLQAAERFPPNVRFALPILPVLLASLVLDARTLSRAVGLAVGLLLFALDPARKRYESVRNALDEDRTVLRGAPADAGWVLAWLREVHRREGYNGIRRLLDATRNAPEGGEGPGPAEGVVPPESRIPSASRPTSFSRADSDGSAGSGQRPRKRDKVASFVRSTFATTDHAAQMLTGARPMTLDNLAAFLPTQSLSATASGGAEAGGYSSSTSRQKLLSIFGPSAPTVPEADATTYFGYFESLPGHLIVTSTSLRFESGVTLLARNRKTVFEFPLKELSGLSKVNRWGLPGVWGGLEGLQIVRGDASGELGRWTVTNLMSREEAFWRLVVERKWDREEDAGWVSV